MPTANAIAPTSADVMELNVIIDLEAISFFFYFGIFYRFFFILIIILYFF